MNVLIVEDESNLADALSHILQESKYHVDCANDGKTGLDWALTNMYDAIVLDIMLPGMDGIEVCRTLRSKGISTPVIMLTARSEVRDKVAGLDAGADDYLTKPFDPEELCARLRALTRRTGEVVLDSVSYGDRQGGEAVSARRRGYGAAHALPSNRLLKASPSHPCLGHGRRDGRQQRRGLHIIPAQEACFFEIERQH